MPFSQLNNHRIFKRVAKALISLHVCAGWSEPLLVAHTTLLEISSHGSFGDQSDIYSFSSQIFVPPQYLKSRDITLLIFLTFNAKKLQQISQYK